MSWPRLRVAFACVLLLDASGCATTQDTGFAFTVPESHVEVSGEITASPPAAVIVQPKERERLGDEVAVRAISLVGVPYRYGGADLDGFDCSGLVYFIYRDLGLDVPRTAADQQRSAVMIERRRLQPGDLVFFRTRGRRISHVGVYVGEDRFVHAPQTGKTIELRSLDDDYYGPRFVAAGRFVPTG
jgi:cell wall-associated NlpC family hydrolase